MKLRNKNTGEILEARFMMSGDKITIIVADMPLCGNSIIGEYDSLAELAEEWGDYTPKEPLFTDEKIRKAVRAWAEANDVEEVDYWNSDYRFQDVQGCSSISFEKNPIKTKNRYGDDVYTIAELCGEEE